MQDQLQANAADTTNSAIKYTAENVVIKINYRFDIGSAVIDLGAAADVLRIDISNKQRITKKNDDPHNDLRFIEPPIFADVNCQSFNFDGVNSNDVALFLLYPDGFVEIEFSIEIKNGTSLESLRDTVSNVGARSDKLEREASRIAGLKSAEIKSFVLDSRRPDKSEDFIAIFIPCIYADKEKISDIQNLVAKLSQLFTQMLRQEGDRPLSQYLVDKHLSRAIYYHSDNAILVGFDGAIYIGEDNIDEANVVDVVNIHRLDLRVIIEFLKQQAIVLNKLFDDVNHRHKLSRKERVKLDQILKQISQAKIRARHVISQVQDPLLLIEDDYLTRVYKTAAKSFGLRSLIKRIETRINEMSELEGRLSEIRMHQHGAMLEWIVIWLIVIEVVPTILKWGLGLIELSIGSHWISGLGGETLEKFLQIFTGSH